MTLNVNNLPSQIRIGVVGENDARIVQIDWSVWAERYGTGAVTVLLQRSGDTNPYPVVTTTDGTVTTWLPSSTDTAVPGLGKIQIEYRVNSVIAKTEIFRVQIAKSLTPETDPPDPYESWLDSLTALASETEQYAIESAQNATASEEAKNAAETAQAGAEAAVSEAEQSAQSASLSAQNASASETNAALFESNAQGYALRAETAQTRAETAQSGAETAESHAQQYASGAALSATQATNSASSAESSANSAASSASSAGQYATSAGESATSASGSASSASQSASSATQSATQASQSASSASQSATSASESASSASQSATAASASASSASQSAENATSYATTAQEAAESASQSASEALETLLDAAPVITDTASGAIASFSDGASNRPVVGLSVGIEPIQSGSGTPSPDNVRTITGHTQATVTRTDGNGGHATTITIQFGDTIYGGTVDVVNGVLTVTYGVVDYANLTWGGYSQQANGVYYMSSALDPTVPNQGTSAAKMCDSRALSTKSAGQIPANCVKTSWGTFYYTSNQTTKDAALAEIEATPVHVVYELATPISIDLTPQQLTTLLGDNSVWADTGDTTVEYRADTKKYIAKMIASAL